MPAPAAKASLDTYLAGRRSQVEQALREALPGPEGTPTLLRQAVEYSLMAGGKRIRPILALAACDAVHGDSHRILPLVVSLEFIHTYSLIHDDLPAMDDDDLRRGRPTSHRVFGEDVAILTGDVLQALAFGVLANPSYGVDVPAESRLAAVAELAAASGADGLVGGQVLDLRTEPPPTRTASDDAGRAAALATLDAIHSRKTGALIRAAVRIGGILGGADERQLAALTQYGSSVGLAFQIADDLLDVDATPQEMGKATHKDGAQRKWAYPAVLGTDASHRIAEHWVHDALDAIAPFDDAAEPLRILARYILDRRS
jgi:geranylgeranyl diphosphate synthase type II